MALIVQKFGGSSVADAEKIKHVAARVLQAQADGHKVCVVVSAMGDTTDELIDLADSVATRKQSREMDMLLTAGERISMSLLALAINEQGGKAKSFTGFQAGISTDDVHGSARIWKIEPTRVKEALDAGEIAIVAMLMVFTPLTRELFLGLTSWLRSISIRCWSSHPREPRFSTSALWSLLVATRFHFEFVQPLAWTQAPSSTQTSQEKTWKSH